MSEVKFIRKHGRIIPIRGKKSNANKKIAAGSVITALSVGKSAKGKTFKANFYKAPMGFGLTTVSDSKRYVPRGFAFTRNTGKSGKQIMYASNLFQKSGKGWGKKLFSAVQFDALQSGKKTLSGLVISPEALRFSSKENSIFTAGGRNIDYKSASKALKKDLVTKVTTTINPKNRSFVGFGLKKARRINKLTAIAGLGLLAKGIYDR